VCGYEGNSFALFCYTIYMEFPKFVMPAFPNFHISMATFINTPVLWIIFGIFFIVYALISIVLVYHWIAYGMKSRGVIIGAVLFISVSIVLFSVSLSAIYYF